MGNPTQGLSRDRQKAQPSSPLRHRHSILPFRLGPRIQFGPRNEFTLSFCWRFRFRPFLLPHLGDLLFEIRDSLRNGLFSTFTAHSTTPPRSKVIISIATRAPPKRKLFLYWLRGRLATDIRHSNRSQGFGFLCPDGLGARIFRAIAALGFALKRSYDILNCKPSAGAMRLRGAFYAHCAETEAPETKPWTMQYRVIFGRATLVKTI